MPYIVCLSIYSQFIAFRFDGHTKILNFNSEFEPWSVDVDPHTRELNLLEVHKPLTRYLKTWWDIFCDDLGLVSVDRIDNPYMLIRLLLSVLTISKKKQITSFVFYLCF